MHQREHIMDRQNPYFRDDLECSALRGLLKQIEAEGYGNQSVVVDAIEAELLLKEKYAMNGIDLVSHAFSTVGESLADNVGKDMFKRGAHMALYALSKSMNAPYFNLFPRFVQTVTRAPLLPGPYTKNLQATVIDYGIEGYATMHDETKQVLDALFGRVTPWYLNKRGDPETTRYAYELGAGFVFFSRRLYDEECKKEFLAAKTDDQIFDRTVGAIIAEIEQIYNEKA